MSLGSKFAFLSSMDGISHTIEGKDVIITSTDGKSFIERLSNPRWEEIRSSDIDSLTLVCFHIQADDHKFGGTRWAIEWFKNAYPDKFFVKDCTTYHKEHTENGDVLVKCAERCYHGLRFEFGGQIYLYND